MNDDDRTRRAATYGGVVVRAGEPKPRLRDESFTLARLEEMWALCTSQWEANGRALTTTSRHDMPGEIFRIDRALKLAPDFVDLPGSARAIVARMKAYRSDVRPTHCGMEQSFTANVVHVEDTGEGRLVALGDLSPPPEGQPINMGTPIHTLLLQLTDAPEDDTIELNDQGNQRGIARSVARIELTPTSLRVIFLEGEGPYAGRVSLSDELEFLEDEDADEVQLVSVKVTFAHDAAQAALLEDALRESASTRGLLTQT